MDNNQSTTIAHFIQANRPAILDAWHQQLVVHARALVRDVGLGPIRQCSEQVLNALLEDLLENLMQPPSEADAERFSATRKQLEGLIQQVDVNNLALTEIITFVTTLKAVVLSSLLQQTDMPPAGYVLPLDAWFNELIRHTFEVYLDTRDELIRDQQRAFMEVSVPVVRLWHQIIMIPLVGMLDSSRTQQMMETMLSALEEYQSKVAILDISGIPVVDTLVARHLIMAASAARLMGAECIITGIRARISQTLVQLGVDLSGFVTRSTLSDGLRLALQMTEQKIG